MGFIATHGFVTNENILRVALIHHRIERQSTDFVNFSSEMSRLDSVTMMRRERWIVHWRGSFSDRGTVWAISRFIYCRTSFMRPCCWILLVQHRIPLFNLQAFPIIFLCFCWAPLFSLHFSKSCDFSTSFKCTFTIHYDSMIHVLVSGQLDTRRFIHDDEILVAGYCLVL